MRLSRKFIQIISPLYCQCVRWIAYGPWGPLHSLMIRAFKRAYGIRFPSSEPFENLGEFFLRKIPIHLSDADLVSPVEGYALEGPAKAQPPLQVTIKGIRYTWAQLAEIDWRALPTATYWNLYLAPQNYHWVHAPCSGNHLEGLYHSGSLFPVNHWGRKLAPGLYTENERITFRWRSSQFGWIYMICVGAMGVSGLRSSRGRVSEGVWTNLGPQVLKGEEILGFELGSTVILLVENAPTSLKPLSVLSVGDAL